MELHTISPSSGYKQEDIVQMAYIMTGWRHKWGKKRLETGDVHFDSEYHQPGKKKVLGKEYIKGKKALSLEIKDLNEKFNYYFKGVFISVHRIMIQIKNSVTGAAQ